MKETYLSALRLATRELAIAKLNDGRSVYDRRMEDLVRTTTVSGTGALKTKDGGRVSVEYRFSCDQNITVGVGFAGKGLRSCIGTVQLLESLDVIPNGEWNLVLVDGVTTWRVDHSNGTWTKMSDL
jgi:hypothetical protein